MTRRAMFFLFDDLPRNNELLEPIVATQDPQQFVIDGSEQSLCAMLTRPGTTLMLTLSASNGSQE